jgi:hypothetical protein
MYSLVQKNIDSKIIKLNLVSVYYYSFLSTFAVILFVNLIPSELILITRFFVIFTFIISIMLINNIKGVLYILLFYVFILLYSLYPLMAGDADIKYLLKNTKYAIYFIFTFGLINMLRLVTLDSFLYVMSKIFVLKLLLVGIVSLNMNFGGDWFVGYLLNGIDLNIHKLFGMYRVFDPYLFLFPLIFIYLKDKKNTTKVMVHILLLFNIASSITFGIIFAYIIIMFMYYKQVRIVGTFLSCVIVLIYHEYFLVFYDNFLIEKSVSIDVKMNQFIFLFNNISILGQGLGTLIDIQGRVDSMLENVFIYWFVVYGIIGTVFMMIFFIFFPFLIYYQNKKEINIVILFYMHCSVLLVTATNPVLESVIGIMPMMIIMAFFFNKIARNKSK